MVLFGTNLVINIRIKKSTISIARLAFFNANKGADLIFVGKKSIQIHNPQNVHFILSKLYEKLFSIFQTFYFHYQKGIYLYSETTRFFFKLYYVLG